MTGGRVYTPEERERRQFKPTDPFYKSKPWFAVRKKVIARDKHKGCALCNKPFLPGQQIQVDHIRPRLAVPALALDPTNLRTVHSSCHATHTHTKAVGVRSDGLPTDGSWG